MTDTEAAAPKPEKTPEQKAQRHVARVLARALSKLESEPSDDQTADRGEGKGKHTTEARKLVRALTKSGVTFQVAEQGDDKPKRGGRKDKKAETDGGDDE